jgi:hypothetical protein
LNAIDNEKIVKNIISKKGYDAEHNYYNYIYNCDTDEEPLFFKTGNSEGILTFYYEKQSSYRTFSSIMAKKNARLNCLIKFLDYVKSKGAKKIEMETDAEFRKEIQKHFRNDKNYKVGSVTMTFTWPVFKMNEWTGDKIEGKKWKDMRYYWHKYFREHRVEFKDANKVDKQILKELVLQWKKQRTGKRVTFYKCYLNAVENNFKGFKTRIMLVDGHVAAITAGFKVPNKNYYYSAIGIYSRDIDRTGEISNLDDLRELKKKGYEYVDFGGGEEELSNFKSKFKPSYTYKTYVFTIVPNKTK